jgi:hypothetical protein
VRLARLRKIGVAPPAPQPSSKASCKSSSKTSSKARTCTRASSSSLLRKIGALGWGYSSGRAYKEMKASYLRSLRPRLIRSIYGLYTVWYTLLTSYTTSLRPHTLLAEVLIHY